MIPYNKNEILISIHVPKTAGSTFRKNILPRWNCRVLHHYDLYGTSRYAKIPYNKAEAAFKPDDTRPLIVHGHFYKERSGIEEYYPQAKQFISILREPFDTCMSRFFYAHEKLDRSKPAQPFEEWIKYIQPESLPCFFPEQITLDNYKDVIENNFIEIGITEKMEQSMHKFAQALNVPFDPKWLDEKVNVTEYDKSIATQAMREEFRDKHVLEYAVYEYVLSKYV